MAYMWKNPGYCDDCTNNAHELAATVKKTPVYYRVSVNIVSSSASPAPGNITFEAFDERFDLKTFQVQWCDESIMWAPCPSSLRSNAQVLTPGAPPSTGAGFLYLAKSFIDTH